MPILTSYQTVAKHKTVDYHANSNDFLCVMLAAVGWTSKAIADYTGLSINQVNYRINKSEATRKVGVERQRTAYRQGRGGVATAVVAMFNAPESTVKAQVVKTLDRRGLYAPQSRGVMKDDKSLPKR